MTGNFKHDLGPRRHWPLRLLALAILFVNGAALRAAEADRPPPSFRHLAPLASVAEASRAAGVALEGWAPYAAREQLAPGDGVTAVVSLIKGDNLRQWLLDVAAGATTAEEQARPDQTVVRYSATGHEFNFNAGRAAVNIRMIGPLRESDAGRRAAREPAVRQHRMLVSADYLALGLDRFTAAFIRLAQFKPADPSHPPQVKVNFADTPFPAATVADAKKAAEEVGFTAADERAILGASLALPEFVRLASSTPGLRDLFFSIIDVPWWSIIRNRQVALGTHFLPGMKELDPVAWGLPASEKVYALPCLLLINEKPALLFQLAVVAPRPPLTVCAGIVGFAGSAPDGTGPVLTLQVVSTRVEQKPAGS